MAKGSVRKKGKKWYYRFYVEEFAQNVCCQHVIIAYGDYTEQLRDFCKLMDIDLVM